jgi:hypothetical protein
MTKQAQAATVGQTPGVQMKENHRQNTCIGPIPELTTGEASSKMMVLSNLEVNSKLHKLRVTKTSQSSETKLKKKPRTVWKSVTTNDDIEAC